MVNATVDNQPVSIVLDGGQSTTVPSNETFRVSIHLGQESRTQMKIDGIGIFKSNSNNSSSNGHYTDITLTGGQTVSEVANNTDSVIFISGFVVNS